MSWFNIWIRGGVIKIILHYFVEGETERKLIETIKNKYLYSGKIKIINIIQNKILNSILRTLERENVLEGKKLPVYGKGNNVRDWLYVEDHCKGIDLVVINGKLGEVYNIGGFNEEQNINIVKLVIDILRDEIVKNDEYKKVLKTDLENINYDLITYVQDRLGHDMRYAIDPSKIAKDLGWYLETDFETGIRKTVKWYLENQEWVQEVVSGDYQKYYDEMYGGK